MSLAPFLSVTGVAAALPQANVDTDVIMPKQFLKGIDRDGLRDGFFFDARFEAPGKPRPDFVLNREPWSRAAFLVTGANFGCGSSREYAVWGMAQFGIRAVFATSFGGIFFDNCLRNGVPAIELAAGDVAALLAVAADAENCVITVDLPLQEIRFGRGGERIGFAIDPLRKDALMRGLDAVGATLEHADAIREFERGHLAANPWLAD
jgi:3-isopropylmalate/(R)-2-methylmalate dehydratase small subunit